MGEERVESQNKKIAFQMMWRSNKKKVVCTNYLHAGCRMLCYFNQCMRNLNNGILLFFKNAQHVYADDLIHTFFKAMSATLFEVFRKRNG